MTIPICLAQISQDRIEKLKQCSKVSVLKSKKDLNSTHLQVSVETKNKWRPLCKRRSSSCTIRWSRFSVSKERLTYSRLLHKCRNWKLRLFNWESNWVVQNPCSKLSSKNMIYWNVKAHYSKKSNRPTKKSRKTKISSIPSSFSVNSLIDNLRMDMQPSKNTNVNCKHSKQETIKVL